MRLADLTERAGEWLAIGGPSHDVVISSRVRLARNLAGMPFLTRCSPDQFTELAARLRDALLAPDVAADMFYVDLLAAGELDRKLLVERQLISHQHGQAKHPRGVAVAGNEKLSAMVNEEDHLRLQILRSGLQLEDAAREMHRVEELLEQRLDFAFHPRYGYLTACPTNVGTGMRASVMLHLPALKMTGEIEKAFRAARDMRLAIRGLFGEGTEASGDFFQVSNQTTLGKSEEQLVRELLEECVPNFIEYERLARQGLLKRRAVAMDDKIFRALAILRTARLISSEETMYLLSLVRLGVNLGRIVDVDLKTINELFLMTQPAHLQRLHGREMEPAQRAEVRAAFIRKRLGAA